MSDRTITAVIVAGTFGLVAVGYFIAAIRTQRRQRNLP